MFVRASSFNGDMSTCDVSKVANMNNMFYFAESFNSDISNWDVSKVTNMISVFASASSFNSDISKWDVSSANYVDEMFQAASSFNVDISEWDVSKVSNMEGMFANTQSFNIDLSKWDVSNVDKMDEMFWHATSFRHKLCGHTWLHSSASKQGMFTGSRGQITQRVCAFVYPNPSTPQYLNRWALPKRGLKIVRPPSSTPANTKTMTISSTKNMICPKCGKFKTSGRASCCAPGGAWHRNCGGVGNSNVDHRWSEGIEVCKSKSAADPDPYSLPDPHPHPYS
mgnify:CR=1 FL=1